MSSGAHLNRTRRRLAGALVLAAVFAPMGCAGSTPPVDTPVTTSPVPTSADNARDQLAALAAAAQDRHFTAIYTLSVAGQTDRTVTVTRAPDRTWRVDVPAAALGGTTDISLARTANGIFQCGLPSAQRPEPASCVRVTEPNGTLPRRIDPRVQHPFTTWLNVFTDQKAPLAVSVSRPLAGARGTCFSVESTSASLSAPLDVGIYCFDTDGTPTAMRAAFGSLLLAGQPGPPPASVQLAGPVVTGEPLESAAPPASSATETTTATP